MDEFKPISHKEFNKFMKDKEFKVPMKRNFEFSFYCVT